MRLYNPPKMTLTHKKSGIRFYTGEITEYLEYDEDKFIVNKYQDRLI